MTVVCSGVSLITMMVDMLPLQDVVLLPQLIPRDMIRGFAGPMNVLQQQPQSQMPSKAYAYYAMGPPHLSFSFKVEPPLICVSYVRCQFPSVCHVHLLGSVVWVL